MYDFINAPHRKNQGCTKWDKADAIYGRGATDLLPMWIADMDFAVAPPIVAALRKRVENMVYGYDFLTDEYYEAVIGWMKNRHHYEIQKDWITFTPGIVTALHMAVKAVTEPGDEVLMTTPVYGPFFGATKDEGRVMVDVPLLDDDGYYTMDWDGMEKAVTPKTKAMLLCSPHNPLGIVWTKEQLKKMADICIANNVLLVSDEIHSDLIFHGKKHIPTATVSEEIAGKVISCISGTKTFNLAGLQASTTVFPDLETKERFDRFWTNMDIHRNNAFSSVAMETAFNEGEEWLEQLLEYLDGNFEYVKSFCEEHIPQIKVNVPDATYLMWLDCRGLGMDNETLRKFMIEKAGLGLNEGYTFGRSLTGYMRLNAACPRSILQQAMKQLRDAVDTYK